MNEETKKSAEIAAHEYSYPVLLGNQIDAFLAGASWHASNAAKEVAMARANTMEEMIGWLGMQSYLSFDQFDRLNRNLLGLIELERAKLSDGKDK